MSLSPSANYTGASYLGNIKENWLFQLFNQDSYLTFDGDNDYIDLGATTINVVDGSALTVKTYIDIDDEELYITKITGNKITVERGKDGRVAASHLNGAQIMGITDADDALVEMGDDFGFSGEYT